MKWMISTVFVVQLLISSVWAGHFENSNAGATGAFQNQQRAVPEYVPGQSVIVSYILLLVEPVGGVEIVKAALEAGAPTVYLMAPEDDSNTDLIKAMALLKDALGSKMSRVQLIRQKVQATMPTSQKLSLSSLTKQSGLGVAYFEEGLSASSKKNAHLVGPSVPHPDDVLPTAWARDWSPLAAQTDAGEIRLLDLNYFYYRPIDDQVPSLIAQKLNQTRISLPIYNEGGNFMISENGDCFLTDRAAIQNQKARRSDDKILSETEIEDLYKKFVGCKRVVTFPHLPNEKTGHIDMWAKLVNKNTVLVAEIWKETLAAIHSSFDQTLAQQMKAHLDERANEFAKFGYNVVRVPMPIPINTMDILVVTRSYTNSLIVGSTALVPRYIKLLGSSLYPDGEVLMKKYESAVAKAYESVGLKPVFITTDLLIRLGGSIHCSTMQVPSAPAPSTSIATPEQILVTSASGNVSTRQLEKPWGLLKETHVSKEILKARYHSQRYFLVHPQSVTVLDAASLQSLASISLPGLPSSDSAKDIVIVNRKTAYVSAAKSLLLYQIDLEQGIVSGTISLNSIPNISGELELGHMARCQNQIYVQMIQGAYDSQGTPLPSFVAVVDGGSQKPGLQAIPVKGPPLAYEMQVDCNAQKLWLTQPSPVMIGGGGIARIDLQAKKFEGYEITSSLLGGESGGFVLTGGNRGWSIIHTEFGSGPSSHLVQFVSGSQAKAKGFLDTFMRTDAIGYDSKTAQIFFPNPCQGPACGAKAGLYIFDSQSGARLQSTGVDLGFPPTGVVVPNEL